MTTARDALRTTSIFRCRTLEKYLHEPNRSYDQYLNILVIRIGMHTYNVPLRTDEQEVKQFIISKYDKTLSLKENNTLSKDIKSFCFSFREKAYI
jgi:hypothetical protein